MDQLGVLSRASLFITRCGMNSAPEGLCLGMPELLFPITGEQHTVALHVGAQAMREDLLPCRAASAVADFVEQVASHR